MIRPVFRRVRNLAVAVMFGLSTGFSGLAMQGVAVAQATCADLGTTFGQANYSLTTVQAGSHSLWLRVKSADGTPSLKFSLSGGGTLCNQTVSTTGATAWKWVKAGSNFTTTGGTVAAQLAGNEAGVGVDCFVLTSDTGFAPTTAKEDCTGPQVDTTAPTISFTAPANGATISGTTNVSVNAADAESGIANVVFRVSGRSDLDFTDATAPYTNALNTTSITNGAITLTAVATNGDGLTTTITRNVTVNNAPTPTPTPSPTPTPGPTPTPPVTPTPTPTPDTTLPATSITAPANNATVSGSSFQVTATATDNVAVSNVKLYLDGALLQTDNASPYAFTVNTSSLSAGSHTLYTIATDSSNNTRQSSTITITYQVLTPGDTNGDTRVDFQDFSAIRSGWGLTNRTRAQGDLTGDGLVNFADFFQLQQNWP